MLGLVRHLAGQVHGLRARVEVFHYVKAHPDKTSVIRDPGN